MTNKIKAIKGFSANLTCRGFQFEAGSTYNHEGVVQLCASGFHAITGDPLSVFQYYPPAGSKFFRVEISGKIDSSDDDKSAAEILLVGEEIGLDLLAKESVEFQFSRTIPEGKTATGDQGAALATGDRGAALASGNFFLRHVHRS